MLNENIPKKRRRTKTITKETMPNIEGGVNLMAKGDADESSARLFCCNHG